ncbi:MAG: hypothetical protein EXR21_05480 [Flavobacteriaceae bacterium]|nr:hypothetical protein [Flavobacteriaceae bacterium]
MTKVSDKVIFKHLFEIIEHITVCSKPSEIRSLEKLKGTQEYFRVRDFRLGLRYVGGDSITLVRFMHRKDIYKYFP